MLLKAHLTSHSRMSGCRWVATSLWLTRSLSLFLYSSVYSCHLFQISSAFVRSIPFLSFIVPILHECPLGISNSLEEVSSLSHASFPLLLYTVPLGKLSFLSLLISGTLHSDGNSFPFLLCLLLLFFSQLLVRPPHTITLPSCISFSLEWFWSPLPIQCYKSLFIVLQAFCPPDLIPWIWSSPSLYNHKGFDLDLPYFLRFKPEFCNKELIIWATVSSQSCSY